MKMNWLCSIAVALVVVLKCLCPTVCSAETDGDSQKLADEINEYLEAIVPFGFHGAVLIAKDGHVILNQGYGLANLVNATPIRSDTVFDLGSITKLLTAAAVLKLEMQKHLTTKDQLHEFFSDLPKNTGEITLQQLLTHSSGLPSGFGKDYEDVDRDEFIRRVREADLDSAPGEGFSYSNAGYSLLAIVVEMAADESWENYIEDEILRPIGAKRTGYILPQISEVEVAQQRRSESEYPNPLARPGPYWNLLGNGGLLSTTMDLYKLVMGLSDDSVLSSEAREKMTASHVPWTDREGVYYGYGLEIATTARGPAFDLTPAGSGIGLRLVEEEDTQRWGSETLPLPKTHLRLFVPSSPKGAMSSTIPSSKSLATSTSSLMSTGNPASWSRVRAIG